MIPSVASLEYTMRGAASDAVDPAAIGDQQLRMWSQQLEQGMSARDRLPANAGQFADVQFREILADPIACVRRIYAQFEIPLTPEAEARMRAYLRAHPRYEYGPHHYSLEMFGLDGERVSRAFEAYRDRFGVESEAA